MGFACIATDASAQWINNPPYGIYYNAGNVGIGHATPGAKLVVNGNRSVFGATELRGSWGADDGVFEFNGSGSAYLQTWAFGGSQTIYGLTLANVPAMNYMGIIQDAGPAVAFKFYLGGADRLFISPTGLVGIGTSNPTQLLDVNGAAHVSGDLVVDGNIAAKYQQDVAEWVTADADLGAGTVVVLDQTKANRVTTTREPYATTVAGVVSSAPGITLGTHSAGQIKVATLGRVKVKVDATTTPVRIGDMLVTSGRAGYAMASAPIEIDGMRLHRPGTILGKALEELPGGDGEVLALLTLQ